MDNKNGTKVEGVGIGFMQALFLVFLTLKLTHVIDWSWWWVTAPIWIPITVLLFVVGIIFLCYFIVEHGSK